MKTNNKFGLLVGILAIAVMLVGGFWLFRNPAGYLSIDVNPSIKLTYNRLNRVVSADGVNEDGQALIADKSLVGLEVDDDDDWDDDDDDWDDDDD